MSSQAGGPIDRDLQRTLLVAMRDCYPEPLHEIPDTVTADISVVHANLLYLEEHELCNSGLSPNMVGYTSVRGGKITARGLDFLADDGGLSAILGVVTVKLHADTIRDLIAVKIEALPASALEKSALKKALAGLPAEVLRAATTDLVKAGLDHLPDVAHWLQTLGAGLSIPLPSGFVTLGQIAGWLPALDERCNRSDHRGRLHVDRQMIEHVPIRPYQR